MQTAPASAARAAPGSVSDSVSGPDSGVGPQRAYEPGWWLGHLRLTNFRNYEAAELQLDRRPVVLIGPNGAGKTNLLEAVSLLAPGRGLRRASREEWPLDKAACADRDKDRPNIAPPNIARPNTSRSNIAPPNTGQPETDEYLRWSVSASLTCPDGVCQIGTGIHADDSRRSVRIDGVSASQSDLGQSLAVSWLTPQMDGLFLGSPSGRRRFVDRLAIAFDPAHAGRLARYERALRERGRLMTDGQADEIWLQQVETQLAETGVAILATRAALIADLNAESELANGAFPRARLAMQGGGADQLGQISALALEDKLRAEAAAARQGGDMHMPGPQASDLLAWHLATGQPASRASTGEQKALLISIVLAHARLQGRRLGRPPILLLDDVAAHLDQARRQALFEICGDLGGQIWFTGTNRADFGPLEQTGRFLDIAAGQINWPQEC